MIVELLEAEEEAEAVRSRPDPEAKSSDAITSALKLTTRSLDTLCILSAPSVSSPLILSSRPSDPKRLLLPIEKKGVRRKARVKDIKK